MKLHVYEHPCHMLHGVVDLTCIPEGQTRFWGDDPEEIPQYDYMAVDLRDNWTRFRCEGCKHLESVANEQAACKGKYQKTLAEQEVVNLPEKLQKVEAELEEAVSEIDSLKDELGDAEYEMHQMKEQANNRKDKLAIEIIDRFIRDTELYLAQIAYRKTIGSNTEKYIQFIRDLALDAKERMDDIHDV